MKAYEEGGEKLLGGSLDGTGEESNNVGGLLTSNLTLGDEIAEDQESGIGSRKDQSVDHNLANKEKYKNFNLSFFLLIYYIFDRIQS